MKKTPSSQTATGVPDRAADQDRPCVPVEPRICHVCCDRHDRCGRASARSQWTSPHRRRQSAPQSIITSILPWVPRKVSVTEGRPAVRSGTCVASKIDAGATPSDRGGTPSMVHNREADPAHVGCCVDVLLIRSISSAIARCRISLITMSSFPISFSDACCS